MKFDEKEVGVVKIEVEGSKKEGVIVGKKVEKDGKLEKWKGKGKRRKVELKGGEMGKVKKGEEKIEMKLVGIKEKLIKEKKVWKLRGLIGFVNKGRGKGKKIENEGVKKVKMKIKLIKDKKKGGVIKIKERKKKGGKKMREKLRVKVVKRKEGL